LSSLFDENDDKNLVAYFLLSTRQSAFMGYS